MPDYWNLPSGQEADRSANWGLITGAAMAVAVGAMLGIWKLVPGLPFAVAMVIWGVLVIPALVCLGVAWRHAIWSLKLRRAERLDGRSDWGGRLGVFVDVHPYVMVSTVVGGALVIAFIWTVLEKK